MDGVAAALVHAAGDVALVAIAAFGKRIHSQLLRPDGKQYGISDTLPVILDSAVEVLPKYSPAAHFSPAADVPGQVRGNVAEASITHPRTVPETWNW